MFSYSNLNTPNDQLENTYYPNYFEININFIMRGNKGVKDDYIGSPVLIF